MRLKGVSEATLTLLDAEFQFQTGAIKRTHQALAEARKSMFQFQTGAIKSKFHISLKRPPSCSFNSKLVRLKGNNDTDLRYCYIRFNSKLVRLKANQQALVEYWIEMFQFQTGAIKSCPLQSLCLWGRGFNSKLVRLKAPPVPIVPDQSEFQFQTGAIKRLYRRPVRADGLYVSIPNWCD